MSPALVHALSLRLFVLPFVRVAVNVQLELYLMKRQGLVFFQCNVHKNVSYYVKLLYLFCSVLNMIKGVQYV